MVLKCFTRRRRANISRGNRLIRTFRRYLVNERIPDIANNLGKAFLTFSGFNFEIVTSDLRDAGRHQVAITFYSDPLRWIDTIGEYLLLGELGDHDGETLTNLVQLTPFFSIYSVTDDIYESIGRNDVFGGSAVR